jgi:lipid-binding SYLF domain-containing protein
MLALMSFSLEQARSRGLFAGISLEGSTLRSDGSANKKLYGRSLSAKEIVREGKVGVPASGRDLVSLLAKKSPKNESDPVGSFASADFKRKTTLARSD